MAIIENPKKIDKRTVGCIITFEGNYLLEHRSKDNFWGSVSGGIHGTESSEEAVIIELLFKTT